MDNPNDFTSLIKEYIDSRKKAHMLFESCPEEEKVITGIINDLTFSIEWMKNGFDKSSIRKGIHRVSKSEFSKRQALFKGGIEHISDSFDFVNAMFEETNNERQLTSREKHLIAECLRVLTSHQMKVFILHSVHFRTLEQIAEELDLSTSTVQTHLERARKKIAIRLKELEYREESI